MAMTDEQTRSLSFLPSDLLVKILSALPLKSKLGCRCVCRSWNSILSSDNLLSYTSNYNRMRGQSSSGNAWLLLTTKGPFACALDPICNLWQKVPKPACPGVSVLAAAHDLACVGNQVSECRSLIVFNLANCSWKLLPNMLHVGLIHKVTMLVDPVTKVYVIVVCGEDSSHFQGRCSYRLLTEVYDSGSGSWHMADDAPPKAKFGSDPGVWCNGLFYCITELPYGLTAFSLSKGCWIEFTVEMPKGIASPSLMSCMGQLMMVGVQNRFSHDIGTVIMDPNTNHTVLSELRPPAMLSRMRLSLTRSLSWSGPLHMWASSQLRLTMMAWPSIATWSSRSSSPISSSSPMSPIPSSSSSSSSMASSPSSPTSMPMATYSSSSSPLILPPSMKSIKVWSLEHGRQWRSCEEMPEELNEEFMSHLTPKTALVSAGVEEDLCITSFRSPNVAILNMRRGDWKSAARDPFFPRSRDAHLLGFTVVKCGKR